MEDGVTSVESGGEVQVEGTSQDVWSESSMNLLYDIELDATLQFGSREMLLREVLELGPGDVVELNRHVSEPVDLVVGDRIIARGEVVIVDESSGVRVTELLK